MERRPRDLSPDPGAGQTPFPILPQTVGPFRRAGTPRAPGAVSTPPPRGAEQRSRRLAPDGRGSRLAAKGDAGLLRDVMYLTIRLRVDARAGGGVTTGLPADLAAEAADLGIQILPMHPGSDDPQLSRYFYVELNEPNVAGDVAERLGRIASVDSAFIKPPEGPP